MVLADMGAEVVKVEQPEVGDHLRWAPPMRDGMGAWFRARDRSKKSVTLNLKSAAARRALLGLVERADALVESFRPGVMERLGLGFPVLSRRNPGLIIGSTSGYG